MEIYQRSKGLYPFIGTLTEESKLREQAWLKHGCNAYDSAKITSQPMSFWLEQDVLAYIKEKGLEIAPVYGKIDTIDATGKIVDPLKDIGFFTDDGDFIMGFEGCSLKCSGCQRTGCVFCGFGVHLEKGETRFQRLAKTHPKQYEYCMRGGQWVDNPAYDPSAPEKEDYWTNWNPKKIWVPSKEGLGMRFVFDQCNQIYGKDFIKYE